MKISFNERASLANFLCLSIIALLSGPFGLILISIILINLIKKLNLEFNLVNLFIIIIHTQQSYHLVDK